jgi:hypothetical protein
MCIYRNPEAIQCKGYELKYVMPRAILGEEDQTTALMDTTELIEKSGAINPRKIGISSCALTESKK